jgi:alpha-glucosidase
VTRDDMTTDDMTTDATTTDWWRSAAIYQVYPRSFADADGDGIGDLPGITARLDHLQSLSIDAVWVSPFYDSPLHDGGYDVADYRRVDPRLGTMADLDALIAGLHARGMRLLMDIVPNHTSSEHAWFREALAAGPGSPAWDRYVIREGRDGGTTPPNNWRSVFHGAGWSPMPGPDGAPTGFWYLHLFDTTQPDLNWDSEEVRAEFDAILRFWFDRGVDGFRIDVAHGLVKAVGLPDMTAEASHELLGDTAHAPYWDQDGVHEIYRRWRAIADAYEPKRIFCGETWVPNPERLARYQRPDELHTSFNFSFYEAGYDAPEMAASIDATIANHATVGAPPTWVLSNHDVVRHRTRFSPGFIPRDLACTPDLRIGLERARAATLFMLALPGSAYLYQGEELGLPEVLDLDPAVRQDPAWLRSGGTDGQRDGCRVPIPWSGSAPSYGFNDGSASWLPQPPMWAELSVRALDDEADSTLAMYRHALAVRRQEPSLGDGPMTWLARGATLLVIERTSEVGEPVRCAFNLGSTSASLDPGWGTTLLAASGDAVAVIEEQDAQPCLVLGPDTAAWFRA